MTRVARRLACISDQSAASSSVHSIYKNQHLSSHFLCFSQKIHCQSESVTCQRFARSTHLPPTLIRSLFSLVSDSICSIHFSFSFYSPYDKNLSLMHPSPLFYFKPVSLRFCHYVQAMSNASNNQSFVRDGAGYEELYPSGCRDPDELSERSPSAASPS